MKVERHEVGPRMSQIVIHGDTIYLAGIVAQNSGGKSVTDQTKEILATIDSYLAKAGSDKSKLLTANIWLANMDTFAEMNAVWDALGVARQYARTCDSSGPPRRPAIYS